MKNKIFLLVLLGIFLLFSSKQTTYAASKTDQEVLRLKKIFDIGDEYDSFDINRSSNEDDFKTISYNWSNKDKDSSVYIVCDENGNIIDFSKYYDKEKSRKNFLKDRDEILKIGQDFLGRIDKSLLDSYKLDDLNIDFSSAHAYLNYNRYVNDTKVLNDTLSMTVDLENKSIAQYSRTYSSAMFKDGSFPDKSKAISKDQAMDLISKDKPFYLSYLVAGNADKKTVLPAYIQLDKFFALDALSKEFIKEDNFYGPYGGYGSAKDAAAEESEKTLSPVEEVEIENLKGLKSLEDVKNFISKNFDLKNYKLSYNELSKTDDEFSYELVYENKDNYKRFFVDAKDLNLISYNSSYSDKSDKKSKLKEEEAIKKSLEFIKKFNTNKDIDLEKPFIETNASTTNISYYLKKNSHYVYDNAIYISISNSTKQVTSYYYYVNDLKFEKMPNDLISKEKANEIAKDKLELVYSYVGDGPRLIYTFKDYNRPIINAKTGKLIDENGKEYFDGGDISYKNLEDSKYKDEVEYLSSINIGLPGGKDLSEKIKVYDYIYLLNSISGSTYYNPGNPDSLNYYSYEGLKVENLDNNLLRQDAVKWMMNQRSYRNLKDVENVFDSSIFKDSNSIADDYKAYYYIARGLGIYNFDTASPKSSVSIEEALHFIYKSL